MNDFFIVLLIVLVFGIGLIYELTSSFFIYFVKLL
jgi:hypothetical protein